MKSSLFTINDIMKKMENYCVYQERCHQEVENKLKEFNLIPEAKEVILLHLLENNYLNEERFSKAFARGKFTIKKWGKQRIVRELRLKNISDYNIKSALKEIDDNDYINTFDELAEKRLKEIKERNIYKKRKKLADYLLYRGWESDMVYSKVTELIK